MIVVDASVVLKWLLPESGSEQAKKVLAGSLELVVPAIARIEVTAAILRKVRLGHLDQSEATTCLGLWQDLLRESVRVVEDVDLLVQAIQIAIACLHPLIDCFYVAAAAQLGCKLITADELLHARCKRAHKAIDLIETNALERNSIRCSE